MTDKATMEVPAPFSGTVTALHAQPGKRIKVGDPVLSYTPAGVPAPVSTAPAEKTEAPLPTLTRTRSPLPALTT
jgi:pyruvate/2-oxoglutarate dehydrogenase complex dihydrolipoamide acyltransferase (E2) component